MYFGLWREEDWGWGGVLSSLLWLVPAPYSSRSQMERPIHEGLLMQHLAIKKLPALQATIYQNRDSGMHPKPRQVFSLFIRKSTNGKLDFFLERYNSTPFNQLAWISSNDYFTMGFWIYVVRVLSKLRMTRFHEIYRYTSSIPTITEEFEFSLWLTVTKVTWVLTMLLHDVRVRLTIPIVLPYRAVTIFIHAWV